MYNIAIIGSGFIAQNHAAAHEAIEGNHLTAIISNDPVQGEKLAKQSGCTFFETLEEALAAGKIDIVDICVPTNLHETFVIKAAEAKCHVLCEKPITFTLESFDRMVLACEKNGVRFMVAQVGRYWPEFTEIKKHLDEGRLGDIHMIYEKRICQHPGWTTWHRNPKISGGGLYDLNIHDVDFLVSCFGRPKKVYAIGWKSATGCWNHLCTSISWPNGVEAVVDSSTEMIGEWPFTIEFRGTGDKGTLSYQLTAGVNINDGDRGSNLVWYPAEGAPTPLLVEQTDMFVAEISEFVNAISENRPAAVTTEQVRIVLEVILATEKSLEEGVVVEI